MEKKYVWKCKKGIGDESKKGLKSQKLNLTKNFEQEFNDLTEKYPDVKSVQFRNIDKYQTAVLIWYYIEKEVK